MELGETRTTFGLGLTIRIGVKIDILVESLILAQDQRWRRA